MTAMPDSGAPLRIAHRAGNRLARLVAAEAAGVDLIEADLRLHHGRLDVRHSKTMGPIPLLWDRWELKPGWTRRLDLAHLLSAARPETQLMLDLKGRARDLPRRAIEEMEARRPGAPYTVASQSWSMLAPFRELDHVRVVYSAGNRKMLDALISMARADGLPAVGAQSRVLKPGDVEALREQVPTVVTWTINKLDRARELLGWGVNAIISDRLDMLSALAAPEEHGAAG